MATYKLNSLYKGQLPTKVTVEADEFDVDDEGFIVDPPEKVARLLEGMPEWVRTKGNSPFGPKDVIANTLRTKD